MVDLIFIIKCNLNIFFFLVITIRCGQFLERNNHLEKIFKIESYFCITIINRVGKTVYIYNPILLSGKWTGGRYSNKEIQFLNNTTFVDKFTICSKKEDNQKYGPVGRLELIYNGTYNIHDIYIWWDFSLLGKESYNFDIPEYKFVTERMDRYWFRVYLNF